MNKYLLTWEHSLSKIKGKSTIDTFVLVVKDNKVMPLYQYPFENPVQAKVNINSVEYTTLVDNATYDEIDSNIVFIDMSDENEIYVEYVAENLSKNIKNQIKDFIKTLNDNSSKKIKITFKHNDAIYCCDLFDKTEVPELFAEYQKFLDKSTVKSTNTSNTVKVNSNVKVVSKTQTPKQIEATKKATYVNAFNTKKDTLRSMVLNSKYSKSILYTKDINDEDLIPHDNGTTVVFAKNGIFEIVKSRFGIFHVKTQELNIPQKDLKDFKFKDQWFIPKPKLSDLLNLVELDKYVYSKTKAEFYANLVWDNINKKYDIDIPEQEVSGASVKFKPPVDTDDKFTVIDHHSHNVMSSFFSGVDDDNDLSRFKLSIVVGNIDKGFTVAARKVVNGIFEKVDYKEFFDVSHLDKYITEIDLKVKSYEPRYQNYSRPTNVTIPASNHLASEFDILDSIDDHFDDIIIPTSNDATKRLF